MSRTYKDTKRHKEKRTKLCVHHKSGVHKQFKRASAKKARRTPLTELVKGFEYSEVELHLRIPKNLIQGSLTVNTRITVDVIVKTPTLDEVELIPRGLDSWNFD